MKRRIKYTLFLLFIITNLYGQNSLSLIKGNRTKSFQEGSILNIYTCKNNVNDDSIINKYFDAKIISINSDSIRLMLVDHHQTTYFKDERVWENIKSYNKDTTVQINLGINEIYKIRKDRNGINGLFTTLAIISATSATIVAPLIAIDYKNGSFNYEKYGKIAGVSLASFAVNLTLSQTLSYRPFKTKGKRGWTIKINTT